MHSLVFCFIFLKFETLWASLFKLRPNKSGLPIIPYLLCQMPSRIADYSGTASSLYLRQPRQSLILGQIQVFDFKIADIFNIVFTYWELWL
jgi:hypothetical protein